LPGPVPRPVDFVAERGLDDRKKEGEKRKKKEGGGAVPRCP